MSDPMGGSRRHDGKRQMPSHQNSALIGSNPASAGSDRVTRVKHKSSGRNVSQPESNFTLQFNNRLLPIDSIVMNIVNIVEGR